MSEGALVCPDCFSGINRMVDGYACPSCKTHYPVLDGVALLWRNPQDMLLDWQNRFNLTLAEIEHQRASLANSEESNAALPTTKRRLQQLSKGLADQQTELTNLLAPLLPGEPVAKEVHQAIGTQLLSHHGVMSYAAQIFRDWAWQTDENKDVCAHLINVVRPHLPPKPKVLVLGAGAGRLTYDLHHALNCEFTLGIDSNPLLCLIATQMAAGKSISLTEFPIAPIDPNDVVIQRTLTSPAAIEGLTTKGLTTKGLTTKGLSYLCADALNLPILADSVDLIVTPWLLDVIDAPVHTTISQFKPVMRQRSLWLTHGSVAFAGDLPEHRATHAELSELTASLGFNILHTDNQRMPYLQSPGSRHHRQEMVFTQLAQLDDTNLTSRKTVRHHQHLPDWLGHNDVEVPLSKAFQTQLTTTRIHAFIMGLIDGKRDINAMAQVLEEQRLMPKAQARQAIKGFLRTMYEEAQKHDGMGL